MDDVRDLEARAAAWEEVAREALQTASEARLLARNARAAEERRLAEEDRKERDRLLKLAKKFGGQSARESEVQDDE